jgi:uncharacterized phiE125 gp8 family phage protein
VSLAEAKTHLRVDGGDEDALIDSLIAAATTHVERGVGIALITQEWTLLRDAWPEASFVELPLAPLQEVVSVTTYDADGAGEAFDPAHYFADTASTPPRLALTGAARWPRPGRRANGIEIAVTAGFGDEPGDVPQPLRQALLLLIAHWYEQREPVALGEQPYRVPGSVAALLAPYRPVRL